MFCSKCGKEINDEAVICPNCGCKTANFSNSVATPSSGYSDDYLSIREFSAKAKTIRNLGIVAAVLMFGIGIIFSIVIWVKTSNIKVPEVKTANQNELAELADAKRKFDLGKRLSGLPLIAISLSIIIALIGSIL